jgi:hypothetical protein
VPGTEKNQVDYKLDRIELYNKEMDLFIPIFSYKATLEPLLPIFSPVSWTTP